MRAPCERQMMMFAIAAIDGLHGDDERTTVQSFLKELMDTMELDAASKEAISNCMLFVKNREM